MKERPPVTVHARTTAEWVLDGVAVMAVLGCVGLAAYSYGQLPDTIATHFGPSGEADGWGNKRMVWLLPAIAMVVIPFSIYLSGKPDKFNYPYKITEENAQQAYVQARLVIKLVMGMTACLLLFLTWKIVGGGQNVKGPWLLPVILIAMTLPAFFLFKGVSPKKNG